MTVDDEAVAAAPHGPRDEEELELMLSDPTPAVVEALRACPGDVVVLGAGGKMGPSLSRMLRRAAHDGRRVIAVSRFGSPRARERLEGWGVETAACDLADRAAVARLPDAPNVVYMAGQKFGTRDAPAITWAMNTVVPAVCAERYAGSRVVAFSTGNVYALTPVGRGGSHEEDAPAPVGEYAASCVGRERVLEYYSARDGTPVAIVRLNYANDLRYGVLTDLALKVWRGEPVDVAMGYVNVIWQGDANALAAACLPRAAAPPFVVNVTGPETLAVRDVARALGRLLDREPVLAGAESPDALLSDTARMTGTLGAPLVPAAWLLRWAADWVRAGGPLLGKPTKFEARDGKF
ncbi:MAG TPA: NAD-dependent epimerase/dehydratase family protein [Gemmatimonadaceae bacterium]|nr:NAD-dependent epimerase/dehydratase family protein [Gemmatimonadaceae bacterium]